MCVSVACVLAVANEQLRLGRAVTSLLTNAMKFGAGSLIEVAVDRIGDNARLVVTDRGLTQEQVDWKRSFDVTKLPALAPRIAWQGEISDTEIQTYLKRALEQGEVERQTFTLEGAPSYRDFDQVIELAYAVHRLHPLRPSSRGSGA
jgi:hypothetical protein